MDNDVIAVNFGALDAARSSLKKMESDFNTQQDEMEAGIRPLHDAWVASESTAAGRYNDSTQKINQYEAEMIQLVNQFASRVDQARSQQMAMENSIAGTFG